MHYWKLIFYDTIDNIAETPCSLLFSIWMLHPPEISIKECLISSFVHWEEKSSRLIFRIGCFILIVIAPKVLRLEGASFQH